MWRIHKKAQTVSTLQAMIGPLIGVGIVLAIGFLIMTEVKNQVSDTESGSFCGTGFTYLSGNETCCNSTGYPSLSACTGLNKSNPGYTNAWNATGDVQTAMSDIPGWLPIIVVAVIGIALLGLVQMFRTR